MTQETGSFYHRELKKIKSRYYRNQAQLDTVISVRKYIGDHADRNLDLQQLSALHFTSKFHLLRLFKRYYGQTPGQYLIEKRMEMARDLLKEGKSVTETCYASGWESLSAFSTAFRARMGESPSAYQKKQF